jgi:acyl CoA:acetate/3-ketoacid CoA transferase beta subunit
MSDAIAEIRRDEICAVALAETFRGDGEILASPIGILPTIAARLARATFAPDLMLSDGVASLIANAGELPVGPAAKDGPRPVVEGWVPYRTIFDIVWSGRRHVVMGASQIDRFGNQNIACIGDWKQPKAQLLGMRGAPGNTINHPTSYWIPGHTRRSFVARVDVVTGVGYDRAAALGPAASRYHEIRRVVSNLGVFDFASAAPGEPRSMRLVSVHPGVTVAEIVEKTGFALALPADADAVPTTRLPSAEELRLLREVIDPQGLGRKEIAP